MTDSLATPLAFFAFNRPEHTQKVFDAIRTAKPRRLLVVLDGPRPNVESDKFLTSEVRRIVFDIDWDCEVSYDISEQNLGIRSRFVSGLGWVFSQVDEVIVLEDDCLPSDSFFHFQEEMLARYRHTQEVGIVCGFNPLGDSLEGQTSHYFSHYSSVWGWGTWKRVWETYDPDARAWLTKEGRQSVRERIDSKSARRFWKVNFDLVSRNTNYSTWDYQLIFDQFLHGRLNVYPNLSLVTNIGFDKDANHTLDENHPLAKVRKSNLDAAALERVEIIANTRFDKKLEKDLYDLSLVKYLGLKFVFSFRNEAVQKIIFRGLLRLRNVLRGAIIKFSK